MTFWIPSIDAATRPVYLAIADALEADIGAGRLTEATRLPPQRALAQSLGIDFTTVSRAYAEARQRGLVEGRVGQGTFVRIKRRPPAAHVASGLVDMSMNLPPSFDNADLEIRMRRATTTVQSESGSELLLRYQEPGGAARDRNAGVQWLASRLPDLSPDRVLVCPGAQGALLAVTSLLAMPGESICSEALTYPGFRALAAHLQLKLISVSSDENGLIPKSFEEICLTHHPKALYCNPTLHNPTTSTLPLSRRIALIEIARKYHVPIIEDDAYGALPKVPVPPLASLAPELVYHIAGLAKCLAPALRIAYLAVPDIRAAVRITNTLRATAGMASPLTAAIATNWIETGIANDVVAAIRTETASRLAIANTILPMQRVKSDPDAFHIWLRLPDVWTRGEFVARMRSAGIGVVGSDAFALATPPEAVRFGLGAPSTLEDLTSSLHIAADLLDETPAHSSVVI